MSGTVRINRFLAAAGFGSRRACEELIRRGMVTINGERLTKLAAIIDPERDAVAVDGREVPRAARARVLVLKKPIGVMSTVIDTHARRTVIDLARESGYTERLFPVGRLDLNTAGILILTNDGSLAYRLTHPRFKIEKTYRVAVEGSVSERTVASLAAGADLGSFRAMPCVVRVIARPQGRTVLEVRLKEGKKRQIRRMFARFEHPVIELERIALGDLTFDDLSTGQIRELTETEERRLRELAGMDRNEEEKTVCR